MHGELSVVKDVKLGKRCLEEGAKMGCVYARENLARLENGEGNVDLAVRHLRLAAEAGYGVAMDMLWDCYREGRISKPNLEETLRSNQEACNQMDSEARRRLKASGGAQKNADEVLTEHYLSYYNGKINAKTLGELVKAHNKTGWAE